jgi:ADP-ribose pyrophosphatase
MKKIPDNAKKVFEGIIFDVYHWEQEMFDGTTSTFEAVKRIDSNSILAVVDNKIIITKEEQPGKEVFTDIPGGRVERGEDKMTAAKRELLEETGYATDDFEEWLTEDSARMSKLEWNTFYYIARNCKKVQDQNLDVGEKIEVQLISFEEFIERRVELTRGRSELFQLLETAAYDEIEKQKLKKLLGITT